MTGPATSRWSPLPLARRLGSPRTGREGRRVDLLPGFDRRPERRSGRRTRGSVYFTADDQGRRPGVPGRPGRRRGGPAHRRRRRLRATCASRPTAAACTPCAAPSTRRRARSGWTHRPTAQEPAPLPSPAGDADLPGTLDEVRPPPTTAPRSAAGWCCRRAPRADARAAAAVGPRRPAVSWNAWSWRWNPWLMAARGYAVLLPDPALSTGYGQDFIRARLGRLGRRPVHRPDGHHRRGGQRGRTSTRAARR